MKIVIGYDGSDYADAALDCLSRAGLPRRADALVISVAGRSLSEPPPSSYELVDAMQKVGPGSDSRSGVGKAASLAEAEALALSLQASKRLKSIFPDWDVRAVAESQIESPAWVLMERADEWGADLIVVGSQGRSVVGRMILGSVSRKIATDAKCSVLVGRGEKNGSAVRLIIGLDGSESSDQVVRAVAARTWPGGSLARLVTALVIAPGLNIEQQRELAKEFHHGAKALLRSAGLEISSLIKINEPEHLLIEEAETWQADCIFVGARGLGRMGRFLLGSVSTAVVSDAKCSVEIVRVRQPNEAGDSL
ncbi:MAG TPA: universal stress protein [Blastocatellia bacterium]|nr:universal stress protein [Blastocatellia bacterium]